jgi:hypothetical protein
VINAVTEGADSSDLTATIRMRFHTLRHHIGKEAEISLKASQEVREKRYK